MSINATVIGQYEAQWGEGPVWHDGHLLYVDIEGMKIVDFDPATGSETIIEVGERVGVVVPRSSGGWVMGGDNGLALVDPKTGSRNPIADPEPDKKPDNRFNDGKCDPAGRFWAGTITTVKKTGDAALYMLDANGELHLKFPNVTNSNGLAWSADASQFYYIDTPTRKVRVFDFDNATGEISNERIAVDTGAIDASPDGMSIDVNGNLWIAFCRGSAVVCFDPRNGNELDRVPMPVSGVTSCAFGGQELDLLYITTGQFTGQPEAGAGRLYVAEPGVAGQPTVPYAG